MQSATIQGYKSLMKERIGDIDASGHNGLDGVFRKDGKYYVVEGKYSGSASINQAKPPKLPRQMSDDWIATRNWDVVNLDENIKKAIIQDKNYERILAKVDPSGNVSYQKIGADGYVIQGTTGIWDPLNP